MTEKPLDEDGDGRSPRTDSDVDDGLVTTESDAGVEEPDEEEETGCLRDNPVPCRHQ